jgi:thiamine kinase-like enzyme
MLPNQMVLSHNDANMTNCYVDSNDHLTIMDYEFSCLNYVGFELGNMFNEVATEYSKTFEIK